MIKVQYPLGSRWVFASFPESDEEARELATLASLYQSIERRGIRTGLYIVAEVFFEGRTLLVSSLERKESLTPKDLAALQAEILAQLKGARHA